MEGMTVVVIDVNNLKLANDCVRDMILGDSCIINAAKILQSVESARITAYRYGGDEFSLLMENQPEPEALLESIKEKITENTQIS